DAGFLYTPSGLYRTRDGGETWQQLAIPKPIQDGRITALSYSAQAIILGGGHFRPIRAEEIYFPSGVVDDPTAPQRVLRPALFIIRDEGKSWDEVPLRTNDYRVQAIGFEGDLGQVVTDRSV